MSKIINFKARSKTEFDVQLKPYPAVKGLPEWYLKSSPYTQEDIFPKDGKVHVRQGMSNLSYKKCIPLLDGMSAGYIIPLWADIDMQSSANEININWKTKSTIFQMHGTDANSITPPPGYNTQVFKYLNCWIPQTPRGYSCLIISPLGHNDLPFKAIPAIVDTDSSTLELVFPVWIKNDFNGIVEKGTPMIQIIPFKRDNWESTFDYYDDGYYDSVIEEKNFNSTIGNHYLKNHWSKKKFK